jgi:hypothetical protein
MMRSDTLHARILVRWLRRLAWVSLVTLLIAVVVMGVTAVQNSWLLYGWSSRMLGDRLLSASSIARYPASLLAAGFNVILLFGLERFMRYLLAYRAELLARKERAHV